MGLDKTAQGYQEEGVVKLLKDVRDGLRGGVRPPGPDDDNNDDDNNDDDNNDDERFVIEHLLNEINNINKQYNDTIININKKNDDYLKKIREQNDDIEKLKQEVIDNKMITKDKLDEAGKKINKFYQEKSMYFNERKYELRRNSKIIEQRDDIFKDIVRHTRNDESEKQTIIDVLNRDIERLNNLNEEHLSKVYKYEEKIKELKDNLSSEKKAKKRKKIEKIYEDLKTGNEDLLFEFDSMKMIHKMLSKIIINIYEKYEK